MRLTKTVVGNKNVTFGLLHGKVACFGSDDTIGLVDLWNRKDALARSNMSAEACSGRSLHAF